MKKFLLGFVLIGLVGCVDVDKPVTGDSEAVQEISSEKEGIKVLQIKRQGVSIYIEINLLEMLHMVE